MAAAICRTLQRSAITQSLVREQAQESAMWCAREQEFRSAVANAIGMGMNAGHKRSFNGRKKLGVRAYRVLIEERPIAMGSVDGGLVCVQTG